MGRIRITKAFRKRILEGEDFKLDESLGLSVDYFKRRLEDPKALELPAQVNGSDIEYTAVSASKYYPASPYLTVRLTKPIPSMSERRGEYYYVKISMGEVVKALAHHKFKTKFRWGFHRLILDEEKP